MGGRVRTPIQKGLRGACRRFCRSPKMNQDLILWACLEVVFHPQKVPILRHLTFKYSRTCIKRPCIKWSPSIKRFVVNVSKLLPLITVILTSIKRSSLLRGRGHPLLSPDELFLLSWPVLNGHFVKGNYNSNTTVVHTITNSTLGNWFPCLFPSQYSMKGLWRERTSMTSNKNNQL